MPPKTDKQTRTHLARVKRTAAARSRADEQYRAALVAAVTELEKAGVRDAYARVAEVAGVSRQAVRELVTRVRS